MVVVLVERKLLCRASIDEMLDIEAHHADPCGMPHLEGAVGTQRLSGR